MICKDGGEALIIARLDNYYAIDRTNQLKCDLADFFDYHWVKCASVEQLISGFYTRFDKISNLKIDKQLKRPIPPRQANLPQHDRQVIIGDVGGSYEVNQISAALRSVFRETVTSSATQYVPPSSSPGTSHRNTLETPRSDL